MKWFLQKQKLKAKTWLDKKWFLQKQKPKTKTKTTNNQPLTLQSFFTSISLLCGSIIFNIFFFLIKKLFFGLIFYSDWLYPERLRIQENPIYAVETRGPSATGFFLRDFSITPLTESRTRDLWQSYVRISLKPLGHQWYIKNCYG